MTPTESATSGARSATDGKPREWGTIRHKGDGRFFVRFTGEGRQHERGPFTSWSAADKMRRRARALLEGGTPIADVLAACFGDLSGSTLTFRDAAPLYLAFAAQHKKATTLVGDTSRLRILAAAPWAGKHLARVSSGDLIAWLADRQRRGSRRGRQPTDDPKRKPLSTASLNRDLTLISALFRWACRLGYVDRNPARDVPAFSEKGRAREAYLSADESRALLVACSPVLRPVVLAALHTGMRRGELLALRWRSVDLDGRVLVVEADTEKAGRGRVVPLTEPLRLALAGLRESRKRPSIDGSDRVFALADGSAIGLGALRLSFGSAVAGTAAHLSAEGTDAKIAAKRAEAWHAKRDRVTFHTLRHTAASLMVAAGVPILDVARVLGHSTLAVTMRYAHFAPESGRSAIDRLGQALAAPAPVPITATASA